MNDNDLSQWFGEYVKAFAACARGEADPTSMLVYYGVPLLVSSDAGLATLSTEDQVVAHAKQGTEALGPENYSHSDILSHDVTVLNATTALYRGEFRRVRRDGSQISQFSVTYLVTHGPAGRRISALLPHGR